MQLRLVVLMGVSELRYHSLAHLEDLDGEGRVSSYRSRKSHGAVAVHVLASYPLNFIRNCAKDCADGALCWRLGNREEENKTSEVVTETTATRIKIHILSPHGKIMIPKIKGCVLPAMLLLLDEFAGHPSSSSSGYQLF